MTDEIIKMEIAKRKGRLRAIKDFEASPIPTEISLWNVGEVGIKEAGAFLDEYKKEYREIRTALVNAYLRGLNQGKKIGDGAQYEQDPRAIPTDD